MEELRNIGLLFTAKRGSTYAVKILKNYLKIKNPQHQSYQGFQCRNFFISGLFGQLSNGHSLDIISSKPSSEIDNPITTF